MHTGDSIPARFLAQESTQAADEAPRGHPDRQAAMDPAGRAAGIPAGARAGSAASTLSG